MANKLQYETSAYLLQHAHNPVQWYPWGEEALALAKEKDLPILVSIGYAACHWCHVMERESFENEATAAIMNRHFINIKIDREERPDLDHIYMDAVQAITGSGGWPLNVFLTPDAHPFYGGTYFPPVKMYNRSSWNDVLLAINDAWQQKREEVENQAASLVEHIKKSGRFEFSSVLTDNQKNEIFSAKSSALMANQLLTTADKHYGGFGQPPKFLQTFSLYYLLDHYCFYKNEQALSHTEFTIQQMLKGGIYDHLGGGISRYSTDAQWLAPHFEKMLYDNALFLQLLADVYRLTKKEYYRTAILQIVQFLENEMKAPGGGYYAALDADSEGKEGKFYVWSEKQIKMLLGNEAASFCDYYNVSETGNWERENILHITADAKDVAVKYGLTEELFLEKMTRCRQQLLKERNKRIRPATDDKILLGWNALLVTAFCKVGAALCNEEIKQNAQELFEFLEKSFSGNQGELYHTFNAGRAKYPAFADDYAYLIEACIQLQEISGNQDYLHKAAGYTSYIEEYFGDHQDCLFYFTHKEQKDVIIRKTEIYDGATPSINAVMAQNLHYLGTVFDHIPWKERSANMLSVIWEAAKKYPSSFAVWAGLTQKIGAGTTEIAVCGSGFSTLLSELNSYYLPNKVLQSGADEKMPLLKGKISPPEGGYIYVCQSYSCQKPVTNVKEAIELLKFN